jgi:hypothetical protein
MVVKTSTNVIISLFISFFFAVWGAKLQNIYEYTPISFAFRLFFCNFVRIRRISLNKGSLGI